MKRMRIIAVLAVLVLLIASFAGCSKGIIEYGKEYKHVTYDTETQAFVNTGNSIKVNKDFTFVEKLRISGSKYKNISGRYTQDDKLKLLYLTANISSIRDFKRDYTAELKKLGYTSSEINTVFLPMIAGKGELFTYKDYIFKLGSVNASRIGSLKDVHQTAGLYTMTGMLDTSGNKKIKLEEGSIYEMTLNEYGVEVYTKKIGNYTVSGDFITVTPVTAPNANSKVKPCKYLLADITLPAKYQDSVNENNQYNGNTVITVYNNVRIRVIVNSFYTLKNTK